MAKHVFPTPPFWLIMAITGITAALLRTTVLPKYSCTYAPYQHITDISTGELRNFGVIYH